MAGSAIAAVGLQFFLLPNHLVDGGVTGISILEAKLSGWPLGLFLIVFNLPFIVLAYKKFGKEFSVLSIIGIAMLALLTITHVDHGFTTRPFLAAVFGGLFVGIGAGVVIRYGGIIDGLDTIAVLIDRVTTFSMGEAIMAINGVIITSAGFVFGWEPALYSLVAYFVAHKAIDVTVEGLNESRTLWIASRKVREIGAAVCDSIGEPVTYVKEANPDADEPHGVMLVVVTRLQEQKVKVAVRTVDPAAFIVVSRAHEVIGKIPERVRAYNG